MIPWILFKSNAAAFSRIVPVSGKNKPYEPELVVYPVPEWALPSEPLTTWYALWVPKNVGRVTSKELSVNLNVVLASPLPLKNKLREPGNNFSLYLALLILNT